jgi:hypothetical protein
MSLPMIAGFIFLAMQTTKSSIEGSVFSATTNQPIAGAEVSGFKTTGQRGLVTATFGATGAIGREGSIPGALPTAITDTNGHFVIEDVEPGTYALQASADRYARQQAGPAPRGQTGMSTSVTVAAGQSAKGIVFHLMPAGTVSGRVIGPAGEPMVNVQVMLVSPVYTLYEQRNLVQVATGQTNDRGEYRLFWVPPGRYHLSASPATRLSGLNPLEPFAANNKYPRTYYPSTTDISAAGEIEIRPGAEIEGVDIRLTPHATYRIRGRVVDAATGHAPQNANVSMIPRDQFLGGIFRSPVAYNAADGTFEARDVLPGSYWITASFPQSGPPQAGAFVSRSPAATAAVEVVAADVDDLVLTPRPPLTITGRIRIEGQESSATLNSMTIRLSPAASGIRLGIPPQPAQVNAGGSFQIENVTSGEYQLMMPGLGPLPAPGNFYVKEARFGSVDVRSDPLLVSGTSSDALEIVLAQDGAQISGSVVDAQRQPVPLSSVVLIPVQSERHDLYRLVPADASGHFSLRSIPPGAYKVFAVAPEDMLSFLNPTVRHQLEQVAITLNVGANANLTLDLKLMPSQPPR